MASDQEQEAHRSARDKAYFLIQHRRYGQALEESARLISSRPEDPEGYYLMGWSLLFQEEFDEAMQHAHKGRGLDPSDDRFPWLMGHILTAQDKDKKALEQFKEAYRMDPEHAPYATSIAAAYKHMADFDKGIEWADKALEIDPNHVEALNLKGESLVFLTKRAEARACFETALSLDPENTRAQTNLGWRKLREGEREQAKHLFRTTLTIDPSDDQAKEGVKEIMRREYRVYRWLQQFSEWRTGLSTAKRLLFFLPLYFIFRGGIFLLGQNNVLSIIGIAFMVLYILFLFLLTLVKPITNVVLSLSNFGRLVLSRDEKIEGWWIIGTIVAITGSVFGLVYFDDFIWVVIIIALILSIFFVKRIFWTNRITMRWIYFVIYLGGITGAFFGYQRGFPSIAGGIYFITFLWIILSNALINAVAARSG